MNVAKQAYGFGRECDYCCLVCDEPIQNPICQECLATGYLQWLVGLKKGKKLAEIVNDFLERYRFHDGVSVECASCLENRTHVCPSCMTWFLYKITRDSKVGQDKLREFIFMFNLDLQDKHFIEELDELGGY